MAQFKILPNTYILSPLTCFSKKRLFEEICAVASEVSGLDKLDLLLALNERESCGSTVCAKGIGLPHALIHGLDKSICILCILQDEVAYNSVDTDYHGVDMAMAFFISSEDQYEDVAQMLRLVSSNLNNTELANSFRRIRQDNNKLLMLLQKLDSLLSLEAKPTIAPTEQSTTATNTIMQFISDAIPDSLKSS